MKRWIGIFLVLTASLRAAPVPVSIDAASVLATTPRSDLLGINVAVYNEPDAFRKAVAGPIGDLQVGLIRMPGGSVSDRYYWNGHGVIENGRVHTNRFQAPYWNVDFSEYRPGFAVHAQDWGKADPEFIKLDARTMHEVTRQHSLARNMVTVNAGTGTPELAAEWVRWANIENNYDITYWEIGNELNGDWEAGHIRPDGSTMTAELYAEIFLEFARAMKAVDPMIKIGGPACDVEHHEDFFEPLLRIAGDEVDFLTLHYYSVRSTLAAEDELFSGLNGLGPVTQKLEALVKKYQPERAGQIPLSITEWNSKLPKDQDAYRLFNGLWFSVFIGEMMKTGIDSATVWDLFSGKDNGHGMLVRKGTEYVPTGRYWAFWLWSHFMADTLVETRLPDHPDLYAYTTRDESTLNVMVMNRSRSETYPLTLNLEGFPASGSGKEVTLSSREYFWNPYAGFADWNTGPRVDDRALNSGMTVQVPPYCVKVYQFLAEAGEGEEEETAAEAADLHLLLPESGYGDLAVEGWIRAFEPGADQPYGQPLGRVRLSVEGPATLEPAAVPLATAASRFTLQPTGPGTVTVTAVEGNRTARKEMVFKPVDLESYIAWKFESPDLPQPHHTDYTCAVDADTFPGRSVLRIDFPGVPVAPPKNHIFAIDDVPREIPKKRIGGVVFDLFVPEDLELADPGANLQTVLQSTAAYWIPCGVVDLQEDRGQWRTLRLEIPDKKFLQAVEQTFSLRFIMATRTPVTGPIYIDNLGFLLRPDSP